MLVSHGHMDHIGGLHNYAATRGMLSLPAPDVLVPKPIAPAVARMMESWAELDAGELKHNLVGVLPGCVRGRLRRTRARAWSCACMCARAPSQESVRRLSCVRRPPRASHADALARFPPSRLPCARSDEHALSSPKGYFVKPFATTHVVPSQGYVVCSRKQKLREEYLGLPGAEIKALRQAGEDITRTVEVAEAAFTADTTMDFVKVDAPETRLALSAKVFFMECTFVDDTMTAEDAREYGHTHLDEIVANADAFANVGALVLIHFSPRYSIETILECLDRKLPPELKEKAVPLLEGFR